MSLFPSSLSNVITPFCYATIPIFAQFSHHLSAFTTLSFSLFSTSYLGLSQCTLNKPRHSLFLFLSLSLSFTRSLTQIHKNSLAIPHAHFLLQTNGSDKVYIRSFSLCVMILLMSRYYLNWNESFVPTLNMNTSHLFTNHRSHSFKGLPFFLSCQIALLALPIPMTWPVWYIPNGSIF